MKPMPEAVFCPVCQKMGWTDERSSVAGKWPCISCVDDFLLMEV
jgi:hypothetical protein